MDEPIITSLLDTDFYKFTMGQVAWNRHRDVSVAYAFRNRTSKVRMAEIVDAGELREQLEHVRALRLGDGEIDFLRESGSLPYGTFSQEYLAFLANLRLPEFDLSVRDGQFDVNVEGRWPEAIFWEVHVLRVVNALYYRKLMERDGRDVERALAEGRRRLDAKLRKLLNEAPDAAITDFGTRRAFCPDHQARVLEQWLEHPGRSMLRGTSDVALARRFGIPPVGTMAHEMFMVYSGIYHGSDDEIRSSHNKVLQSWWHEYGVHLSVALTDTYGSEFFFRDMTVEQARNWRALRQDSGDPFSFGERAIGFYEHHGIDPTGKTLVFSDGLDADAIVRLHKHFDGRIATAFGWGTDLTNDCGYDPLSLVVKAVKSCGHPTVKLSDNPAKATGPAEEVERYLRIFDAQVGVWKDCRV